MCYTESIYVISSDYLQKQNIFKIGLTNDIERRLFELNSSNPVDELALRSILLFERVKCADLLEKDLHQFFASKLKSKRGWFELTKNDLKIIESTAKYWNTLEFECKCVRTEKKILKRKF